MDSLAWRNVFLFGLFIVVYGFSFILIDSAVTPTVDVDKDIKEAEQKAQDPCQNMYKEIKSGKGSVATKDPRAVLRVDVMRNGNIKASCRLRGPLEKGYVTYCDRNNDCRIIDDDNQQKNILKVYDETVRAGVFDKNGNIDAGAAKIAPKLYTPEQVATLESKVIGWAMSYDPNLGYVEVVDRTLDYTLYPTPEPESFGDVSKAVVNDMARLADQEAANLQPPKSLKDPSFMLGDSLPPGHLLDFVQPQKSTGFEGEGTHDAAGALKQPQTFGDRIKDAVRAAADAVTDVLPASWDYWEVPDASGKQEISDTMGEVPDTFVHPFAPIEHRFEEGHCELLPLSGCNTEFPKMGDGKIIPTADDYIRADEIQEQLAREKFVLDAASAEDAEAEKFAQAGRERAAQEEAKALQQAKEFSDAEWKALDDEMEARYVDQNKRAFETWQSEDEQTKREEEREKMIIAGDEAAKNKEYQEAEAQGWRDLEELLEEDQQKKKAAEANDRAEKAVTEAVILEQFKKDGEEEADRARILAQQAADASDKAEKTMARAIWESDKTKQDTVNKLLEERADAHKAYDACGWFCDRDAERAKVAAVEKRLTDEAFPDDIDRLRAKNTLDDMQRELNDCSWWQDCSAEKSAVERAQKAYDKQVGLYQEQYPDFNPNQTTEIAKSPPSAEQLESKAKAAAQADLERALIQMSAEETRLLAADEQRSKQFERDFGKNMNEAQRLLDDWRWRENRWFPGLYGDNVSPDTIGRTKGSFEGYMDGWYACAQQAANDTGGSCGNPVAFATQNGFCETRPDWCQPIVRPPAPEPVAPSGGFNYADELAKQKALDEYNQKFREWIKSPAGTPMPVRPQGALPGPQSFMMPQDYAPYVPTFFESSESPFFVSPILYTSIVYL